MKPEDILAWATICLAVATFLLVIVGAVAARAALGQVRAARDEARASSDAAAANAKAVIESRRADHLRRRGEATMAAVIRFDVVYDTHHRVHLRLAREKGINVKQLLARDLETETEAKTALQRQLDAMEMLGLGARTEIFDLSVIYEAARSVINQLWDRSTQYRTDIWNGTLDKRPPQPSAYEHAKWLHDEMDKKHNGGPVRPDGAMPPIG